MDEENIEVTPSEDNGNVPVDFEAETPTPTPSETPAEPVTPADDKVEEVTPTPEVELYELPDGRKVDAETLSREWKENFYPEYTRKSQELAAKTEPKSPVNPTAGPEWVPQSYEEIIEVAKRSFKEELANEEKARIEHDKAIEDAVTAELNELKTVNPTLNENALFQHATKYGFRDLKTAYKNMEDMNLITSKVQKITTDNIKKRTDPVSVIPGGSGGAKPDPSQFQTAVEYMRSIKS